MSFRPRGRASIPCLSRSAAACLVLAAAGCAPRAQVHPEYARLQPQVVAVLPVDNETIHQLDQVTFGGLLQRTWLGARAYNIPDLLRGAIEEALVLRGYSTVRYDPKAGDPLRGFKSPLPPDSPRLPFDAVCLAAIESWQASTLSSPTMFLRYRLAMRRLPAAESLYAGTFECGYREDARSRGAEDFAAEIRHSAQRALSWLPPSAD